VPRPLVPGPVAPAVIEIAGIESAFAVLGETGAHQPRVGGTRLGELPHGRFCDTGSHQFQDMYRGIVSSRRAVPSVEQDFIPVDEQDGMLEAPAHQTGLGPVLATVDGPGEHEVQGIIVSRIPGDADAGELHRVLVGEHDPGIDAALDAEPPLLPAVAAVPGGEGDAVPVILGRRRSEDRRHHDVGGVCGADSRPRFGEGLTEVGSEQRNRRHESYRCNGTRAQQHQSQRQYRELRHAAISKSP